MAEISNPLSDSKRPWGEYKIIDDKANYKVKVIAVRPGQRLSYQSHERREEHWVVVEGEGLFTLNDTEKPVKAGTYVKIPAKAKHRIQNVGKSELIFIEVQLGSYFGEDDIQRFQDDYNRA